jgi:hypothetical protein
MRHATLMKLTALASAALFATACGGSSAPAAKSPSTKKEAASSSGSSAEADPRCPMLVKDVDVVAAPIAYGAELAFTTSSSGSVGKLQERLQHVVAAYNPPGSGLGGDSDTEADAMPMEWPTPPFETEAEFEETELGGRVKVTATDAANAEALRDHLEKLAREMQQSGTCPTGGE